MVVVDGIRLPTLISYHPICHPKNISQQKQMTYSDIILPIVNLLVSSTPLVCDSPIFVWSGLLGFHIP